MSLGALGRTGVCERQGVGSGLLGVASVAFDDQAIDAGLFGAFDDGDIDLSVAGGVELVQVGFAVTCGVGHPYVGLAVTVGIGAEDDVVLIALSLDRFFGVR